MGVTMKLDRKTQREFSRAVDDLSRLNKKTVFDVMKQQGRLLCVDFNFHTRPYGKEKTARDKTQSQIEGRIRRIYWTVGQASNKIKEKDPRASRYFNRLVRERKTSQATALMVKYVGGKWQVGNFDGGRLHQNQRHSKHVNSRLVVLDKPSILPYIRKVKRRVGYTKSAFASAADDLGGSRGIPAWAKNHERRAGSASIRQTPRGPLLRIENRVRDIRYILSRTGEQQAIAHRTVQIRKDIKQRMDRKAKQRIKRA